MSRSISSSADHCTPLTIDNKEFVKQFETELNVALNNLELNNVALQRNQSFDQSFESGALDSQILDIVNVNLDNVKRVDLTRNNIENDELLFIFIIL